MIPDYVYWIMGIIGSMVALPIILYLCVKLVTVAYYRGKSQAARLERQADDPIIDGKLKPKGKQHGSSDER